MREKHPYERAEVDVLVFDDSDIYTDLILTSDTSDGNTPPSSGDMDGSWITP